MGQGQAPDWGRHRGLPLQRIGPPSGNAVGAGPRAGPLSHTKRPPGNPGRPPLSTHPRSSVFIRGQMPLASLWHRLESLCHRRELWAFLSWVGVWLEDAGRRGPGCKRVGLEIDLGEWALARFCAPWVPNAGEKEKNALPRKRAAFGLRGFGTRSRRRVPARPFFSFSPGSCLRCKKRAKAHAPRPQ